MIGWPLKETEEHRIVDGFRTEIRYNTRHSLWHWPCLWFVFSINNVWNHYERLMWHEIFSICRWFYRLYLQIILFFLSLKRKNKATVHLLLIRPFSWHKNLMFFQFLLFLIIFCFCCISIWCIRVKCDEKTLIYKYTVCARYIRDPLIDAAFKRSRVFLCERSVKSMSDDH